MTTNWARPQVIYVKDAKKKKVVFEYLLSYLNFEPTGKYMFSYLNLFFFLVLFLVIHCHRAGLTSEYNIIWITSKKKCGLDLSKKEVIHDQ